MIVRKQPSLAAERVIAATLCFALSSPSWAQVASPQPQEPQQPAVAANCARDRLRRPQRNRKASAPSIAQQAKVSRCPLDSSGWAACRRFMWSCHIRAIHLVAYRPSTAPPVDLTNSPRLESLERDGKLYLSLRDAVFLALENNLDLAYFRYNLPIAQADLARTKAGGQANGVNTSIAQGTQGGFNSSGYGGRRGRFEQWSNGRRSAVGLSPQLWATELPSTHSIRRSLCKVWLTTPHLSRSTPCSPGYPF